MEQKNIVATVYLKNGKSVRSMTDFTETETDVYRLCQIYNDSGIDKIVILDLSTEDDEHDLNIHTIKNINRNIEIKVCAGGNINRLEDVRKLLYAGCLQVILNASKPSSVGLAREASKRFGRDRILVSISNVDFIFKNRAILADTFHEVHVLDESILDALENLTNVPYVVNLSRYDYDQIVGLLRRKNIRGIAGAFINDTDTDIMKLKSRLSDEGIRMDNFAPDLRWSDLKLNSDGMVPVIVQDYRTDEVLMLAYMDEEAFNTTLHIGKMTYYSRSRKELWTKGLTSGHIQYVKSLTADCDFDTILAKVSQVGPACHTGSRSCFFNEIVKKEYVEKNPLKVLESVYDVIKERRENPKDGSYTNYLFKQGVDEILKCIGKESIEIILAAKSPEPEELKFQISDFLYNCMILMVEKGLTWEEVATELAQR
ncbi:MAG: bifunctional phosphoribosyl-AMP cyclohydrolase/phosphoribosyl-ATP diphosphatase HisIE [Blautia sp.]|nr:bifunctional phosphoribosyl-AMP cyclohydrolase/phosphoribosyl-ATP diphosphatase HisIE [Blautia sp.]